MTGWVGGTWGQPVNYDYGNTIVYEGDNVYQDGQPIASAQEYAQQAQQIAQALVTETPEIEKGQALFVLPRKFSLMAD